MSSWMSRLSDLGRLGPDDLPLLAMFLVRVSVPITAERHLAPPHYDLEPRLVSNDRCQTIQPYFNRVGLPNQVVDLSRGNPFKILLLRKCASQGVYQLEVVRMKLACRFDICRNQRAESFALRCANL